MTAYAWVKLVHIVSATVLFGTGLGIAFFMWRAHVSGRREAMAVTVRNVVLADWLFTTPAVVVQLATGLWLTPRIGIAFDSAWFVAVICLFVLVGICWIPVVWIQIRIRGIVARGGGGGDYGALMKIWIALGIPAFGGVLMLFFFMVSKMGANRILFG